MRLGALGVHVRIGKNFSGVKRMNTSPPDRLLHPIPEARKMLGDIGHTKFYQIVGAGKLKLVKIGRRSFLTDEEIRRYAASLQPEGGGPEAETEANPGPQTTTA